MTKREFNNLKLPALVKRIINGHHGGKRIGDCFVCKEKSTVDVIDENDEHHFHGFIDIVEQNYNIQRLQMLEIENEL